MRGDLVFEAIGGVDPKFILEADPSGAGAPVSRASSDTSAQSPKGRRPHSGWVAAAVCAVVALGVYLGMMWLGQGEWQPPAATAEGTEKATEETTVTDPDETTEVTSDETSEDTAPPDDGLTEPSPTYVNPLFTVEKIGANYFLNLYSGNQIYGGMTPPYVSFEDVEDMFRSLYYGDLDELQQQWLSYLYLSASGYQIVNICDLVTPILEEDGHISNVKLYGTDYTVVYTVPSLNQIVESNIQTSTKAPGWAAAMVAEQGKNADTGEETVIDGMSAVITTEDTGKAEFKRIYLSYTDEATGNEMYAEIIYLLSTSVNAFPNQVSDTIPWEVNIVGTQGSRQYTVNINNIFYDKFTSPPDITKDFLRAFMLQPFDTPRVEPTAIIEKEPYEIIEEDGTWYLTFPEWDGRLPDGLAPMVGQVYPAVDSVIDLYNGTAEQDMSLYHQMLFMLNADENGRVRLPAPNTLLSPSFPETHMKAPVIKLNAEGFYEGYVSYADCTGTHYTGFAVTSEAVWQEKLSQMIPIANENDVLSVTTVEGMYDGLPCTFYEFTYMSYGFQETSVLCHIRPEGDQSEQVYFLNFYASLEDMIGDDFSIEGEFLEILDAYDVSVYGTMNGQYYFFTMSELQKPTADVLSDFAVTPVTP